MKDTTVNKITKFTDLKTWQSAHKLVVAVYAQLESFPKSETYSLVDQLKRCSVSVSSNIAEGFSRQSKKEKQQFYFMAKGSITELQNQLLVARDVGYLSTGDFTILADMTIEVHKLLNGLIKTARSRSVK